MPFGRVAICPHFPPSVRPLTLTRLPFRITLADANEESRCFRHPLTSESAAPGLRLNVTPLRLTQPRAGAR